MSNNAIYKDPKFWGKHYWFVMKCIAANYPMKPTSENKERAKRFFSDDLLHFIPCDTCRHHYSLLIRKYPVEEKLCCGECLSAWVLKIQDKIEDIKKGKRVISLESDHKARNIVSKKRKESKKKSKKKSKKQSKKKSKVISKAISIVSRDVSNARIKLENKPENKYDDKYLNKYIRATSMHNNKVRLGLPEEYNVNRYTNREINNLAINSKINNINAIKNGTKFSKYNAITFSRRIKNKK